MLSPQVAADAGIIVPPPEEVKAAAVDSKGRQRPAPPPRSKGGAAASPAKEMIVGRWSSREGNFGRASSSEGNFERTSSGKSKEDGFGRTSSGGVRRSPSRERGGKEGDGFERAPSKTRRAYGWDGEPDMRVDADGTLISPLRRAAVSGQSSQSVNEADLRASPREVRGRKSPRTPRETRPRLIGGESTQGAELRHRAKDEFDCEVHRTYKAIDQVAACPTSSCCHVKCL